MAHALRAMLVVGVLLAAGLVYAKLAVPSEAVPPGAVQNEPALPRAVTAVDSALPTRHGDAATPALEREVAPPPIIVAGRTSTSARLLGRCVAAEDGAPLENCVIEIFARGEEQGTTGPDGCFAIDFVPMPSGSITVRTEASGRVPLQGQLLVEGGVGDLGTIRMPRGFFVSGRVVDPDGTGVPGHTVIVADVDTALRPGQVSKTTVDAACADDGSFTLGLPLPAGEWHAKLRGPRRQRGDGAFRVHPLTGVEPLALVVEPPNEIVGVVVDEAGQPLCNVGLCTEHGGATASSQGNGAFELIPQQPVSASTRILLRDPETWSKDFVPPTVAWGQRDVRIVIPGWPSLTIEVVDDSGAPVTEFGVYFQPAAEAGRASSRDGMHPGGRIDISPSRRGRYVLRVCPRAKSLLASEPRFLDVGSTPLAVQRFVLERLPEVAVQVAGADQAVEGAAVELLLVGDDPELAKHGGHAPVSEWWVPQTRAPELVSAEWTDASGLCSLHAPANCRGYLLRVRKKGLAPAFVFDPPLSVGGALRVVLASGGALLGSVELHEQARRQFKVRVTHADGRAVDDEDLRALPLYSDLTFAVPVLVPGDYVVQVLRQIDAVGGDQFSYVPGAPPQRVTILAGQTTEVHLDAPPVVEGSLAGRLVTGAAAKGHRVQLVLLDAENAMFGTFAVADDGSFLAEALLPGRYQLAVHSLCMPAVLAAVVEIAPGVVQHQDFVFTARKLTLRFRTPAGEPATGNFELRCGPLLRELRLTESNTLVLDPAPELPIQVRYSGVAEWSEAITMPGDRTVHTAEVVVKPRR